MILLVIWGSSLGLPVPEEVPLLTAGVLASQGTIDVGWAIVVGLLACLSGDLFIYAVGRKVGPRLEEHRFLRRLVRSRHLERARSLYVKRGPWALCIARLLPGLKMPFLFTAGALRMPFRRFLAYDLLSVLVLIPGLVLIGYHSSRSMPEILALFRRAGMTGLVLAGLGVAVIVALALIRRRRLQIIATSVLRRGVLPPTVQRPRRSR